MMQYQIPPTHIAHSMGRLSGKEPASIVGALADLLAEQSPEPGDDEENEDG